MEGVAGRRGSPGKGGRREGRGALREQPTARPLEQEAAGSGEGRAGVRPRGAAAWACLARDCPGTWNF